VSHLPTNQFASVVNDNTGDLVVNVLPLNDYNYVLYIIELPNPKPSQLRISVGGFGIAVNDSARDLFIAQIGGPPAEFTYPGGQLVGTVSMPQGAYGYGIAVDR
jgi:hypothetical protein